MVHKKSIFIESTKGGFRWKCFLFMILKNQEFDIRSSLQIIFSDHADTDTVTTRSDVAGNAERKRIIVDIHFREGRRKHICPFFFLLCTKTGTCGPRRRRSFGIPWKRVSKSFFRASIMRSLAFFMPRTFANASRRSPWIVRTGLMLRTEPRAAPAKSHPAASFEKFQCIDGNVNAGVESICFRSSLIFAAEAPRSA